MSVAKATRIHDKASNLGNFRESSKAPTNGFDTEIIAYINKLIDYNPKTTEPNTAFAAAVREIKKLNLCYVCTPDPAEVMVHPDNRGNKMVSKESRENKARGIATAGVKEPAGGTMFELCPLPGDSLNEFCVRANKEMVERSNGYIAPLNGSERFLSVATSNCYQVARAINACCPTDVTKLQDAGGKMSRSHLASVNPEWATFCGGWPCLVFKWVCDVLFPKLAFLAQLAKNTDNMVGVASGDLECITTMLRSAADGRGWDECVEVASSSWDGRTPLDALRKVAQFFGPEHLHLFERLQAFRSALECEITFGGEFLSGIVSAKTTTNTSVEHVLVRLALLAVQLVSPNRDKSGHASLVKSADIHAFVTGAQRKDAEKLEHDATDLLAWVGQLETDKVISNVHGNNIFFKFITRCVLFHRNKQNDAYEERVYKSVNEIKATAAAEVARNVPKGKRNPCTWTAGAPSREPLADGSDNVAPLATQVGFAAVQNSVAMLIGARDLAVGVHVFDKRVGTSSIRAFYTIKSVNESARKVTLVRKQIGGIVPPFEAGVDVYELLKFFQKSKEIPQLVAADDAEKTRVAVDCAENVAAEQCLLAWKSMMAFACSHEDYSAHRFKIVNGKWGTRVYAARDFQAGELVITPRCNFADVHVTRDTVEGRNYIEWSNGDERYCFRLGSKADRLEPFFIVRTAADANMRVDRTVVGGLVVPVMSNSCTIKVNTELVLPMKQHEAAESLEQRHLRMQVTATRKWADKETLKTAPHALTVAVATCVDAGAPAAMLAPTVGTFTPGTVGTTGHTPLNATAPLTADTASPTVNTTIAPTAEASVPSVSSQTRRSCALTMAPKARASSKSEPKQPPKASVTTAPKRASMANTAAKAKQRRTT
jgi:hypothetical protein